MIDLGRHAAFIWASYGVVALALMVLVFWLLIDGRRQLRLLADFDARGITRRSRGRSADNDAGQSAVTDANAVTGSE